VETAGLPVMVGEVVSLCRVGLAPLARLGAHRVSGGPCGPGQAAVVTALVVGRPPAAMLGFQGSRRDRELPLAARLNKLEATIADIHALALANGRGQSQGGPLQPS